MNCFIVLDHLKKNNNTVDSSKEMKVRNKGCSENKIRA